MANTNDTHAFEKLFRSKNNRTIAGVCGGLAEYFKIDPLIVRFSFIVSIFFAGAGFIAYIAAIFIIPENPNQEQTTPKKLASANSSKQWGIILIIIGSIFLIIQLGIIPYFNLYHLNWQTFFALLFVSYGLYLILKRNQTAMQGTGDQSHINPDTHNGKFFYRINQGKMIGGVCTGLSAYFNLDVGIIRLIWAITTLLSGGIPIIAYLIALFVFPALDDITQLQAKGGK